MTVQYIWMEHDITHGRQVLPDIEYWRANGWNPCDGPYPEPDLTKDPAPPEDQPPEDEPEEHEDEDEALPDAVGLSAAPDEEVAVTSAPSDEQEDDNG
jgi:hypothetical protein